MAKKNSQKSPFRLSGGWIAAIVIVAIVAIVGIWLAGTYNSLVTKDEVTKQSWADVQTAYQRRADLIPNLVATVKAYSTYEGDGVNAPECEAAPRTSVSMKSSGEVRSGSSSSEPSVS